ncbi:TonB-dependent receptor domain-containing protein [Oceanimonas doudoroffii]|uniref:TonB-dependent receptor-like beta-barrel domain-containing protein n=1 Tax=Oceanimonas doudoroffii TaxID=84158 RepID=A0A233RFI6_9GAMM|nr:TonB-dependent receptor [Oceanimonas doudoroffii]OXY82151.1 hypothetical protein B6S08_01020 [Oceanimonas doudoroffii]
MIWSRDAAFYLQGLTYHRQGWTASMTLFDNRFDDKIVTTDCPAGVCFDPDARHYTNVDKARTQGVELSTTAQLTATVKASANYTYTRSEQLSGEHRGQPLTQMPLHLFASSVDWQMAPRLGGWLKYEYRGTESQETGLSSNTATRAPAYSLFHLGLQYEASRHIVLQAGIDNLLDEPFEFAEYGFVDSGRAYWASAEYRF